MSQKESSKNKEVVRRLNVPLAEDESEKLKKLAEAEDRSEGKNSPEINSRGIGEGRSGRKNLMKLATKN
jgi:hypothetical protein